MLGLLVRRSLSQHLFSTVVTALSVALATGLVMSVLVLNARCHDAFVGGNIGFDAVLGARGSQLQLVLNSVFHLQTSPGNVPYSLYESMAREPDVELAVPYAVGDNYRGYRIVGSTPDVFRASPAFRVAAGRSYDPAKREAVVGSFAAERLGLSVGDTFNPYHGVVYDPRQKHADVYTVTGVLAPTSGPADRVIWIPIDGVYGLAGHAIASAHKEVSAVMLKFRSPQAGFRFEQLINRQGKVATLAWPIGRVMAELFDKLGWMHHVLTLVAWLVGVVAAGSILASLYNAMNERRRDFAILRALGARRRTVFTAIVLESTAIAALGSLAGVLVYLAIMGGAAAVIRRETGVVIDVLAFHSALLTVPLAMSALGACAGIVPACRAYATDVASHLTAALLVLLCVVPAHAHEHRAPHHGALVELGQEAAHLELVLDAKAGVLTAYVLDGEAEQAVRTAAHRLLLTIHRPKLELELAAVANPLTGETVGDTSEFRVQSKHLEGVSRFEGVIPRLTVRGVDYENVPVQFPGGGR